TLLLQRHVSYSEQNALSALQADPVKVPVAYIATNLGAVDHLAGVHVAAVLGGDLVVINNVLGRRLRRRAIHRPVGVKTRHVSEDKSSDGKRLLRALHSRDQVFTGKGNAGSHEGISYRLAISVCWSSL